ncbi:phosphotransferase family protein [Candidimonas nitroreducens]|uniref:Phosphotransferase family protein n=1 Tax=Candidimonas nitroreducens TaxID=683354 RepID=A0A225N0M5_9BURK|nr:phosphotransferase family protein [Candidimonas nitroreducens]OWT66353.1 phosphotransferase family protein [Candidimonas nitroreducens]
MISSIHAGGASAPADLRDNPTPEFIEALRRRFPTDPETDALLVRKMRRRSGPPYQYITLDEMIGRLRHMLADVIHGAFEIAEPKWLTGGASKVQMAFKLNWTDPARGPSNDHLVIRMDPSEASNTTSRVREAELLDAFQDILPVPKVFWLDAEGRWFPEPAIIYSFVHGVTRPRHGTAGRIVGLGTNFGPALRETLAPQFLQHLAAIHTADVARMSFTTMAPPAVNTDECARLQLNRARRVWEEDRAEAFPLMEVAANWLERNLPILDRVSVVHGDYRSGNFLFDESSGKITAWLDWERGHLGDRHRDLAWLTQKEKGHVSEDGKTYLVCGLIPLDEFNERYAKASGLPILQDRLTFYRILNCYQIITTVLATANRVAKLGKSHQDVLLARLKGIAPVIAKELSDLLEEHI